jgi:hypothetical protein
MASSSLALALFASWALALCAGPLLQMMAALGGVAKHYIMFQAAMRCEVVSAVTSAPVAYGFVALHCSRASEDECFQVVYIRACVEETGASKLFSANITADDPFEMVARESFQIISSRCI